MKTGCILVVDDTPMNLRLTEVVLKCEGHTVVCAKDAQAALAVLGHTRPDLILMDLQMPGMDGLTLTRRLKADPAYQHLPIVAFTSYAMKGDEEKALAAGCDGYITKPIDTRALPGQVSAYLERHAALKPEGA